MTVLGAATRLVNWPRTQNQDVVDELEERMIPALNIDPRNVDLPATVQPAIGGVSTGLYRMCRCGCGSTLHSCWNCGRQLIP